ncbi:MAG: type I pullulanase [Clostridium sp.]
MSDNVDAIQLFRSNIYEFENKYYYPGELGSTYTKEKTIFTLWAPCSNKVFLLLYGIKGKNLNYKERQMIEMSYLSNGAWQIEVEGDLHLQYYNFLVLNGELSHEVVDPYARSVSVNGLRSQIVDMERVNPPNFKDDKIPPLISFQSSSIYEMHIRDFTIDEASGISPKIRGKYLGFCEDNTYLLGTSIKTGLSHLKELGITHVHLLPFFDFSSVDESNFGINEYNWGYDPQNYNALEGSYSIDPINGESRITEFKTLVQTFHKNGIRIIMDVVYNHTFKSDDSNLNKIVPKYYYRQDYYGCFSNGSGCGNELCSERKMVRKLIIDSIIYFAKEYHIDGFRFDLMGLHDIDTIKLIREELNKINSSIIIYGEGWTGGDTPLPYEKRAIKDNLTAFDKKQIAIFSDDIRDGIKGHVFYRNSQGFVSGAYGLEETIKFGVVGSVYHPEIDINKVNYSNHFWANEPYQTINYCSSHDNYTLFDKLFLSNSEDDESVRLLMNKLAATIIFTSQGIPFIQGGEELLRQKKDLNGNIIENSYNSSDIINKINWSRKKKYSEVFNIYKELISIKKEHPIFSLPSSDIIRKSITFLKNGIDFKSNNLIAFRISGSFVEDTWKEVIVIYNANREYINVSLPKGEWTLVFNSHISNSSNTNFITNIFNCAEIGGYILAKF